MTDDLKILVIDDSEDDRLLYRRTLEKSGDNYHISEAADGEEGLKRIQLEQPDCVLLDYSMPGRNGIEILKRIRTRHAFTPVVMLTGQGNETVAVACMKEGAQDYIAKSTITTEALERVVRVAIEHSAMQQRIHEQRTSLEIFTHALAHDLKEPTNTISSFIDLVMTEELSEKGRGYAQHVRKAADRMQNLIDTVALYTRIDVEDKVTKESCPLNTVLQEAKENLSQLIKEGKAVITEEKLPTVTANRTQLLQLLQNLLANAIRHGGPGTYIHVGVQERHEQPVIYVRDNGPGIEKQYLDKIFDPFKRMSSSKERGLGLGLAISRKIVESHEGKIWCESSPGVGTTFFFLLAKSAAMHMPTPQNIVIQTPLESKDKNSGSLARILLVDDNEADVALNRIMLIEKSKMRCEVLTACDGQDALEKLHESLKNNNPIDLVLLDINMPVMSGFEFLAKVQMDDTLRNTMVVMCTTSAYDLDKKMARDMGASGYLTKPPQFPSLKAIIEDSGRLQLRQDGDSYALMRAA